MTAACPVPIVIAGGKKLPEREALQMAYEAIDQGAAGRGHGTQRLPGRAPVAMLQAVRAVVHDGEKPEWAFEMYRRDEGVRKPARRTRYPPQNTNTG